MYEYSQFMMHGQKNIKSLEWIKLSTFLVLCDKTAFIVYRFASNRLTFYEICLGWYVKYYLNKYDYQRIMKSLFSPGQALGIPRSLGYQISRQSSHEGSKLSALRTGGLYSSGNIPGTHFCQRMSRPQNHMVAGRIMSMENSIGNRICDLPAFSVTDFWGWDAQ